LPPGSVVVGVITGLLVKRWRAKFGNGLIIFSALCGMLVCLPIVAGGLAELTEQFPPIQSTDIRALDGDVIVILAGGKDQNRVEYGGVTVSKNTLQRLRYGALLARALELPILVTGGTVRGNGIREAVLMAEVLSNEFGINPQWVEDQSRNTAQNAMFSAAMIGGKDIILVTHALHMWRAQRAFANAGMTVSAAPVASVAFGKPFRFSFFDLLPSEKALVVSRDSLHELLGIVWYAIRY
ncbi:MAG: YdcF family protein, partial [Gammaproteobacteria bacterium]